MKKIDMQKILKADITRPLANIGIYFVWPIFALMTVFTAIMMLWDYSATYGYQTSDGLYLLAFTIVLILILVRVSFALGKIVGKRKTAV